MELMYGLCALVIFVDIVTGDCPDGFQRHDGSCFKIPRIKATWPDATKYCKDIHAELAEITTADKNKAVVGILQNAWGAFDPPKFWVSANDILQENVWSWAGSGTFLNDGFHDWKPGQPDNGGDDDNENCLELTHDNNFQWNDQGCEEKRFFICEKSAFDMQPQVIG